MNQTTTCLRCGAKCRRGTPDPNAREIVQSATTGYCANCMITKFLKGVETINDSIERKGSQILIEGGEAYQACLKSSFAGLLGHTQMPADEIDWHEVVENWNMPFQKSR